MATRATPTAQDTAGLDVERGDEVYFRHKTGPLAGKVLSRGAHGVVVEHKGQRHKIHWGDLHGHKVKVRPEVSVVDQGEDGMIVQDKAGQRRFVHDPLEPAKPEPLTKSCRPVVLLFGEPEALLKAGIKGGSGLHLETVTDKRGHQTKRWKRGDKVSYTHPTGGHPTHGEVVGEPGADGAHVQENGTGATHQVLHRDLGEHKPTQEAAEPTSRGGGDGGGPEANKAQEGDDLGDLERANNEGAHAAGLGGLLRSKAHDALPNRVSSAHKTWEEIAPKLQEAQAQLTEIVSKAAAAVGATQVKRFDDEIDKEGPIWGLGPPKTEESARRKADNKYGGDFSRLGDAVRGSMGFDSVEQLKDGVAKLEAAGLKLAAKADNKFTSPTSAGYRDMNLNVLLPNGVVGELQLHLKPILKAKRSGHHDYDVSRVLEAKLRKEGLSTKEQAELQQRLDKQRKLYGEAMREALKAKGPGAKSEGGESS